MKILIVGATGVLGIPLAAALVAKNYDVIGLSNSSNGRERLEKAGAPLLVADALDPLAMEKAFQSAMPDCVIDLLTAIPKNGVTNAGHMQKTNDLRVKGTANILSASITAGSKRIVAESMIFAYGFGYRSVTPLTESDMPQIGTSNPGLQEIAAAARSLEEQFLEANRKGMIETIPLRYGNLYGSGSPSTEYNLKMLQKRFLPISPRAGGITSWIYTTDAVTGTIAAMERGHPGEIYNIVDDVPVSMNEWFVYAAKELGAKPPISIPLWLLRGVMPFVAEMLSTRMPVSNLKAKTDLQWRPRYSSYREGLHQVIAEYRGVIKTSGYLAY